jgi:opacity protein-like surface antigen
MQFRRLLLGSVVILAGGATAHSADLPVPDMDEFVKVCGAFGTGFHYIPGTDTCLQIGGEVLAEMHYVDGDVALLFGGATDEEFNNWTTRSRAYLGFDARTQSELGLIRTYILFELTVGPDDFVTSYEGAEVDLNEAFVQVVNDWGTFTAGHASSFFDFFSSDTFGTRIDIDDNTTEQTLFAYTFEGENGFRGTLSIEDPASSGRRLNGADDYEGQEMPDLIGTIGIEQDWGSAQIMAVLRRIDDEDGDGLGWAVGAGISTTLPVLELGVSAQAAYAEGAIAYATTDPGGLGDFNGPTGEDTNQAWSLRAGVTRALTSTVSAWIDGSFTHAETGDGADEYDFWALVAGAAWAPTDNLWMGPEFGYNRIEGDDPGEDGEIWGAMWRVASDF